MPLYDPSQPGNQPISQQSPEKAKASALSLEKYKSWIIVLLFMASVHCALCIFFDNVSVVDLRSYAEGLERTPYQDRVAMMPVLRFAESDARVQKLATRLETRREQGGFGKTCETLSPEKLICMAFGVASMLALTLMVTWFARRHYGEIWWISGALLLEIFYVSYAARTEANFWYPYDLPHCAIFAAACLALLEGRWVAFLALFLLDIPFRETGIFLLPALLLLTWHQRKLLRGVIIAAVGLAAWVPFRLWVTLRYAHNPTELGIHKSQMLHVFLNPLHWPQTLSAFGFLLLPLLLARKRLSRKQQLFLWSALPGVLVTLAFGVWYESRIFDEWAFLAAVLLTGQLKSLLDEYKTERAVYAH